MALSPAQVDGILEAALLARELGRDDLFRVLGKDEAVEPVRVARRPRPAC